MTVTVPVSLSSDEQAALQLQADAQGVSVDSLLRKAVLTILSAGPASVPVQQLRGADLERAFEELADLIPENVPPIPDDALSREGIYTREDKW
jgi:hypothetical protein